MGSSASAPSPTPSAMASPAPQTFTDLVNKWLQSIAIVGAGIWAVYTFIYKEIRVPETAPINITITMQLKKLGAAKAKTPLVPIEMRISATNPSSRKIYFLPNKWMVWGYKVDPQIPGDLDAFHAQAAECMNRGNGKFVERYSNSGNRSVVAGGSLFSDNWLNPSETLARTIIFYVPHGQYDSIYAQTVIPSFEAQRGLALEWKFDKQSELILPNVYVVNESGERTPAKTESNGQITDRRAKELGFQVANSSAELSLWE